jgi:hypothetical protein
MHSPVENALNRQEYYLLGLALPRSISPPSNANHNPPTGDQIEHIGHAHGLDYGQLDIPTQTSHDIPNNGPITPERPPLNTSLPQNQTVVCPIHGTVLQELLPADANPVLGPPRQDSVPMLGPTPMERYLAEGPADWYAKYIVSEMQPEMSGDKDITERPMVIQLATTQNSACLCRSSA